MDLRYSSINNTGFTISIRLAGFFIAKVQTAFKITDSQTITFEMQMNIKRKKWLVNIDRYISWFNRMPATFRLWWRTDREGTGARRWTEVPRFWGWPTSWSPKRIYHTTTTLCCSLSKLTYIHIYWHYVLSKTSYLTSLNVHIGFGLIKKKLLLTYIFWLS